MDEHQIKIGLIGCSKVGKSSILQRYINNNFKDNILPTALIDLISKEVIFNGIKLTLRFYDFSNETLTPWTTGCKDLDACIIIYSIYKEDSLSNLSNISEHVNDYKFFIIGHDCNNNNSSERILSSTQGLEYGKQYNIDYYEANAKSGDNINEVMDDIITNILIYKGIQCPQPKKSARSII